MNSQLTQSFLLNCPPRALSPRRVDLMNLLHCHHQTHGYSPTVREMAEGLNMKSHSAVHSHLEVLTDNGFLSRNPRRARSWRLTARGRHVVERSRAA